VPGVRISVAFTFDFTDIPREGRRSRSRASSLEFQVSISLARNANNLHARVFFPHIKRVAYYTTLQQEEGRERRRGKTRGIYSYAKECEDRDGIVNDEWN